MSLIEDDGWAFVVNPELVWARCEDEDPYGRVHEVQLNRDHNEVSIRAGSNDRGLHFVATATAPVEVVAEVLRRAGYTVTPPPDDR